MIAGVCNGIAAHMNIDPTIVRLAFVLLTIFWGTGLLVYVVMAIVVPEARSPEEKAPRPGSRRRRRNSSGAPRKDITGP